MHNFCDLIGFCVTVTNTNFIYTRGEEPGLIIGLINYPRSPKEFDFLKKQAVIIAKNLMNILKQEKVTIVFPDETVMLTPDDN